MFKYINGGILRLTQPQAGRYKLTHNGVTLAEAEGTVLDASRAFKRKCIEWGDTTKAWVTNLEINLEK